MRRGFDGLSAQVQTILEKEPLSGHVIADRVTPVSSDSSHLRVIQGYFPSWITRSCPGMRQAVKTEGARYGLGKSYPKRHFADTG